MKRRFRSNMKMSVMTSELLSDIALITPGTSPKGELINSDKKGFPFFQGSKEFQALYPRAERFTEFPVKVANKDDILISVRAPVGQVNLAPQDVAIGRGVMSVRPKQGTDRFFIFYLLKWLEGRWDSLGSTGSIFENLSVSALSCVEIPKVEHRESIGRVLFQIDCKIQENSRISKTLEEFAQTIFKSWFVDFDPIKAKVVGEKPVGMDDATAALFPDSMEDSELGPIPVGWTICDFGDVNNLLMGQSPPGDTYNTDGDGVPFYQGRTDFGMRFPKQRVFCTAGARFASAGDVLVSVRAPVGDLNQAIDDCVIGRGVASVLHKSGSQAYSYALLSSLKPKLAYYNGEGTVFGAINRSDFNSLKVVEPSPELIERFDDVASPLNDNIRNLFVQTESLTRLRDSLLPRLISGELQIPEEMLVS